MSEALTAIRDSSLYNEDLAPVPAARRTWGMWNIAALWVGMAVCIPTYTLAAGLIAQGMNWRQALATITLGAVAGVMLADYYLLRGARLDAESLYLENGEYAFGGSGFNWRALVAVALGISVNVPGFLAQASGGSIQVAPIFESFYTYAWFVSLLIAGLAHIVLSTAFPPPAAQGVVGDEKGASR